MNNKATGYSIWLMPEGVNKELLQEMNLKISRKYRLLHFKPHVTLIGGITGNEDEIIFKTKKLAKMINPYHIEFAKISYSDEYFKALFVMVNTTFDAMKANKEAQKVFELRASYMPHLSLAYGDFDKATKEEITNAYNSVDFMDMSFLVTTLHLYLTEGSVDKWKKIGEFSLQ